MSEREGGREGLEAEGSCKGGNGMGEGEGAREKGREGWEMN